MLLPHKAYQLRLQVKKHHQADMWKHLRRLELDIFMLHHDYYLSFRTIAKLKGKKQEVIEILYKIARDTLCYGKPIDRDKRWRWEGMKKAARKMGIKTPDGYSVYISSHTRQRFMQRKGKIKTSVENYVRGILSCGHKVKYGKNEYKYETSDKTVVVCKEKNIMVVKTIY